jgi:hypothetical protein
MLYQCGVKEIVFSDISSPKISTWGCDYDKILELMGEKIHLRYVPRQKLDPNFLLEANAKIAKNEENE